MSVIFESDARNQELALRGYVVVPLLDANEIRDVQTLHDSVFPTVPFDFHSSAVSATADQRLRVLAGLRAIVGAKLDMLLPRFRVRFAAFMTKRPNSQRGRLPLHQDPWITDHRDQVAPAVWCPLVDVDRGSACLRMVPGSQHMFRVPCPMNALAAQTRHLTYQWDADPLPEEFVHDVPLQAGTAVVYDPRILHGSGDNATDHARVAFNCVTVPRDREARVYFWDEGPPGAVQTFEATEAGLCELRYDARPTEPYPAGLRLLNSFDVPREPMRVDVAALRQFQAHAAAAKP